MKIKMCKFSQKVSTKFTQKTTQSQDIEKLLILLGIFTQNIVFE